LTGEYEPISSVGGETRRAFVPRPLPPDPPLEMDQDLERLAVHDSPVALGRLDSVTTLLPDPELFLYMYVRKEAVLSSQIEGTQSSLNDLLLFENEAVPGVPVDDVQEVSNYVAAINHGIRRLREGFPVSLRLLREIHGILLAKGRGSEKEPGEFRTSQNWIGGTRPGNAVFVPPPPTHVIECMGALEKFLHDDPVKTPPLIKAALAHVQFETIHPFLDGNGRVGRLLITLLLCAEGTLKEPLLYPSLYFKTHRQEYYDLLQQVRTDGDWEAWLRFFLNGLRQTAELAVNTAQRLTDLFAKDRQRIQSLGRTAGSALRVHDAMQQQPVLRIPQAARMTDMTPPTATMALKNLERLGIVREITGRRRNRIYVYNEYIAILSEGTEPL